MLEELTKEIERAEEQGATDMVIILNPFFANLYNIHHEYKGYMVQEASLVSDFKIIL